MSGYSKTAWANGAAPAISADNLGKLETADEHALGVDTIAALRVLPVPTFATRAWIRGHSAVLDGGGGAFDWDASCVDADDDGITALPASHTGPGRWVRNYSSSVNIQWFGATGDGSTDDAPAVQKAFDSHQNVYVPPGDFVLESKITAALSSDFILAGEGKLTMGAENAIGLYIIPNGHNVSVRGIEFFSNHKSSFLLTIEQDASSHTKVSISDCVFDGAYATDNGSVYNLHIRGGYDVISVTNCVTKNASRKAGTGNPGKSGVAGMGLTNFNAHYPKFVNVDGCTFTNLTNGELSDTAFNTDVDGLKIFTYRDTAHAEPVRGSASISNCEFNNCKGRSIKIQNDKTAVDNCHFYSDIATIKGGSSGVNMQISSGQISNCSFTYGGAANDVIPINFFSLGTVHYLRKYQISNIHIFNETGSPIRAIINCASANTAPDHSTILTVSNLTIGNSAQFILIGSTVLPGSTGKFIANMVNVFADEVTDAIAAFGSSLMDADKVIINVNNLINNGAPCFPFSLTTSPGTEVEGTFSYSNMIGVASGNYSRFLRSDSTSLSSGHAKPGDTRNFNKNAKFMSISLDDNELGEINLNVYFQRAVILMSSNFGAATSGLLSFDATGISAMGATVGPKVAMGVSADPDVAGSVNLWKESGVLHIHNKLGAVVILGFLVL